MTTVKLIALTKGTVLTTNDGFDTLTAEQLIAFTARVSNPANAMNMETAPKLLNYLIKNAHWSPFEMVSMTIQIETSRGIAAQVLRHRSFSFQEFSQRYAEAAEGIIYPARRQDNKNRQNSIDDLEDHVKQGFEIAQKTVWDLSFTLYKNALAAGVAKEQARFLLPLSTKTTLFMTGNIRSWIHYIELRKGNGTQLEHREIALGVLMIMRQHFPSVSEAMGWEDQGL